MGAHAVAAQHQRLGLGNGVDDQAVLVRPQVFAAAPGHNKFHGHHILPLVQQLKKGVLAIGARLAPDDGGRGRAQALACVGDALAVALHLQLLQIRRQAAQAMAVGGNAAAAQVAKIAVPNVQQRQAQRQIVPNGGIEKVRIHGVRPGQQVAKLLLPNGNGNRQANGRPQRKAPPHPVRKLQAAGDAKRLRCRHIGGQRHKVLGNRHRGRGLGAAALAQKPFAGRVGVEHGLGRGEGFGGNQKQRRFRPHLAQHMAQLMPIDVRDKVKALARIHPILQPLHHHLGPQVRAANADVHNVGNLAIGAHLLGQRQHGVQGVVRGGQGVPLRLGPGLHHRVLAQLPAIARHAQQPVHGGAPLGGVDRLARQHGIAPRLPAAVVRQGLQQGFGLGGAKVFRQIGVHVRRLLAVLGQALRVAGKRLGQIEVRHVVLVMGRQGRPGGGGAATHAPAPAWRSKSSSLRVSTAKARMPSASFSVAMASSFRAKRKLASS